MSNSFDQLQTALKLGENEWRVRVGNPYVAAYTQAYTAFKEKLAQQKESDKQAGELFVTAACVATGSILLASFGSVTLKMLARRTIVQVANRSLGKTFSTLFRVVRKNEGVVFAVGGFVDFAKGDLKKHVEKIAADAVQSLSNIVTPEPLVQYLQLDSIMRANVNCSIRMGQAIDQSMMSAQDKTAAFAQLLAAPLANTPTLRSSRSSASLSELIELTFYLSQVLESDSLVNWPASIGGNDIGKATSAPITARPSDKAHYPNPPVAMPTAMGAYAPSQSVAIDRAGGEIQKRTDELCKKVFGKPLYGSSFLGLIGPADTQKPAELLQADLWLDQLATSMTPLSQLESVH